MTSITRRTAMGGALGVAALPAAGRAQNRDNTIRIGVLADFSGPYRDTSGPTSVAAVQQAIEDLGVAQRGINVEVIQGDHLNRPDAALALARRWIDTQGVDMICEVNNSAIALAVANLVRERDKVQLASGAASSALTGPQCSTHTLQWTYDTWMFANVVGGATVRSGGDSWYFITADYAFGHQLERDAGQFVTRAGGRVMGSARYPFPGTTDFSSFLLQAQASRAQVIGLANAGGDTINSIKQAAEFGITRRGVRLAGLLVFATDVHSLGLQTAQGLVLTETFYWDLNDKTRAFTQRLGAMPNDTRPSMVQAGCYSSVLHYLKAVGDMGVAAAKASGVEAVNRMKAMPTSDDAFGEGSIRADGRKLHPAYLFQVKTPEESRGPWDYYKLLQTVPADRAFRPMADGNCAITRS